MLKKIKSLLSIPKGSSNINPPFMINQGQEDTRDTQTRRRVATAFEQQKDDIAMRLRKAHDGDCENPLDCKRETCFNWKPDRIVSHAYIVTRTMRLKEQREARRLRAQRSASLQGGVLK